MFQSMFNEEEDAARRAEGERMLDILERDIGRKLPGREKREETPAKQEPDVNARIAEIDAELKQMANVAKARELRAQADKLEGESAA